MVLVNFLFYAHFIAFIVYNAHDKAKNFCANFFDCLHIYAALFEMDIHNSAMFLDI